MLPFLQASSRVVLPLTLVVGLLVPAGTAHASSTELTETRVGDETYGSGGLGLGDVGDLDGDGVPDLAVGHVAHRVVVHSGVDFEPIRTYTEASAGTNCAPWTNVSPGHRPCSFGVSTVSVGDVDQDRRPDVAIADAGRNYCSGERVCFEEPPPPCNEYGPPGGCIIEAPREDVKMGSVLVFANDGALLRRIHDRAARSFATQFLLSPGDLDGDGRGDIVVDVTDGNHQRSVRSYSAATGRLIWSATTPPDANDAGHGVSGAAISDITRDGVPDVLVGDPSVDVGFENSGALYVHSGATGHIVRVVRPAPARAEQFGSSVVAVGDDDGDGIEDYASLHQNAATIFVLSGADDRVIRTARYTPPPSGHVIDNLFRLVAVGDPHGSARRGLWVIRVGQAELVAADGTLAAALDPRDQPAGDRPVAVGDLGGDAGPDLLVGLVRGDREPRLRAALIRTGVRQLKLSYDGPSSGQRHDGAGWSAVAQDARTGDGVAGVPLTFTLTGAGGRLVATRTTGADGSAAVAPRLLVPPGDYTLRISAPRTGRFEAATADVAFTVTRRAVTLAWTGDSAAQYSDPARLAAAAVDATTNAPLSGLLIQSFVGSQRRDTSTGLDGSARADVVLDQAAGDYHAGVLFGGDDTYSPATVTVPFRIEKETVAVSWSGDVFTADPSARLAAVVTQDADGSPGDLTGVPVDFTASGWVDGTSSTASAPIADDRAEVVVPLSPDLYAVSARIPRSNPYYTSRGDDALAELVVTNADTAVVGRGESDDGTEAAVSAKYAAGVPRGRLRATLPDRSEFVSSSIEWLTGSAAGAVVQAFGYWDGQPANARLLVRDAAPGSPDLHRLVLRSRTGSRTADTQVHPITAGDYRLR